MAAMILKGLPCRNAESTTNSPFTVFNDLCTKLWIAHVVHAPRAPVV